MKLVILSRHAKCYSTSRLVEASLKRGHEVEVLDTLRFSIDIAEANPQLFYQSAQLPRFDFVLPRIAASITEFGIAVVRQFEQLGILTANSSEAIANSRDKLRALQLLSGHAQIRIPNTTFVRCRSDVLPAIERIGGVPVVVKLLEGTQGIGVILAETARVAESIIETMQATHQKVLMQKFVAESRGRDIRALVVGDRVVAAMRRIANGDEFRSNVHRGGRTEMVELSEEDQQLAVTAAGVLGLSVAGVDMLESKFGPQIMEVNSSPGLQGIETCTGQDVAGAIVDYMADRFANVDALAKVA